MNIKITKTTEEEESESKSVFSIANTDQTSFSWIWKSLNKFHKDLEIANANHFNIRSDLTTRTEKNEKIADITSGREGGGEKEEKEMRRAAGTSW